jgi:hypothetical protein
MEIAGPKTTVIGVAVTIAVALLALFFIKPMLFPGAVIPPGFTPISISSATFQSSNPDLNADAFLLTAALDGSSGYAKIDSTVPGFQGEADLTIQVTRNNVFYQLTESSESISPYGVHGLTCCVDASCATTRQGFWYHSTPQWVTNYFSSFPAYDYEVVVAITNKTGNQVTGVITPGNKTVFLKSAEGELVAKAYLPGALLGDVGAPNPAVKAVALRTVGTQDYRTASWLTAMQYQSSVYALQAQALALKDCTNTAVSEYRLTALQGLVTAVANAYNAVDASSYSEPPWQCVFVGTNFVCPAPQTRINLLNLVLKADWVKFVVPSSQPKIVSAPPASFVARIASHYYDVVVQNVGSETDSFDVSMSCVPALSALSELSARVSLDPGAQATLQLVVSAGVGDYSCVVQAHSVNDPRKADAVAAVLSFFKPPCIFGCCIGMLDYADLACPLPQTIVVNTTVYNVVYSCVNNACIETRTVVGCTPTPPQCPPGTQETCVNNAWQCVLIPTTSTTSTTTTSTTTTTIPGITTTTLPTPIPTITPSPTITPTPTPQPIQLGWDSILLVAAIAFLIAVAVILWRRRK